jgi:hypothetical protein
MASRQLERMPDTGGVRAQEWPKKGKGKKFFAQTQNFP